MPALFFPSPDALRLALVTALVPPAVARRPARAGFADGGRVWLDPDTALPRDALAALAKIGVRVTADAGADPHPVSCWAEALPLRRAESPAAGRVLFVLTDRRLARFLARLRRHGRTRVGVRLADVPGRAWVAVDDPPHALLLECREPDPPAEAFREQAPGVWVADGWEHPLPQHAAVAGGGVVVLVRTPREWSVHAGPVPEPTEDDFPIPSQNRPPLPVTPESPPVVAGGPRTLPPLPVRLTLARAADTPAETLWAVPADSPALAELLATADERALARFEAVEMVSDGRPVVLVRPAAGRRRTRPLPIDADGFYADPHCPGLFIPAGRAVRPAVRADVLAAAVGVRPGVLVWLEPEAGGFTPRSAPAAGFAPLRDRVEYAAPPPAPVASGRSPADPFALLRFTLLDDPAPPAPVEPPAVTPPPRDAPSPAADDPRPGWLTRALDRLTRSLRRAAPEAPTPPPTPPEPIEETPHARVGQKLASSDALVHGQNWPARRREAEDRILRDLPALGPDDRAGRWADLAAVYAATGNAADAAVCWLNAVWDRDPPPAAWLELWFQAEARAARQPDPIPQLDGWLADPARGGPGRVVAAFAALAGAQSPPHPAVVERLPRLVAFLDHHFDDLPARAAWLARTALAKLSDGDALGLARWRDRLLARLREKGPGLDLDEPSFLRFHGTSSAGRFQAARDWLARARDPVQNWVKKQATQGRLQWAALDAETEHTAAYADLMLAWGLGCLGERGRARECVARAKAVLARDPGPRTDPAVPAFLFDAFARRIDDTREGRPPRPGLPPDLAARLDALPESSRYAVDRLRELSRVLEPIDRVNAFRGRDVRLFRGSDLLGERLHLLADATDPAGAADEARQLLEVCAADPTSGTVPRVVFTLLEVAPRLDDATAGRVLHQTIPAVEWLEAALQAGPWKPAERADRLAAYLGRMVDAGFRAAARAAQPAAAKALADHLTRRVTAPEVRRAVEGSAAAVFRALRTLGLRAEAEGLLRALDPGVREWPAAAPFPPHLLGLAVGWYTVGREDDGNRVLNAARDRLYLEGVPDDRERTTLALAYADALGSAPPRVALGRLEEVFQRLPGVAVRGFTNQYYSLKPLELIDTAVRSVVGDELALGPAVRGWLDDDEFLIRRRVHSDLSAVLRKHDAG